MRPRLQEPLRVRVRIDLLLVLGTSKQLHISGGGSIYFVGT